MKVWLSRNAKRLAALTLTLVLVLALAACGSKTQTPETSSTPTVVTPPVQTPADPATDCLMTFWMGCSSSSSFFSP